LIADLDSEVFAMRDRASRKLERLGDRAEPALRQAQKDRLSPELHERIEKRLARLETAGLSPDTLRVVRAVETLEHAGTAEARQLLAKLATGAPEARLTREAKAALRRLMH
jgi:hypothetical protein